MATSSPRLDLPYIQPSQAQKHVTHNEALQRLDILTQLVVLEVGAQTSPAEPETGETHALGSAPTGTWAGQAGRLAYWTGNAWLFVTPHQGWRAFDRSSGRAFVHDGTEWKPELSDLNNLGEVGIGTGADATNRLAVASPASLFSHAGAGHQIKINKADDGDTASVLFQSNWTGHAEMGLAGDTTFAIKTSADGSNWQDMLRLNPTSQQIEMAPDGTTRVRLSAAELEIDTPVTGSAVQSGTTDVTDGRLVRVEGAHAAALSHHTSYYSANGTTANIDTCDAGFAGLIRDANAGTWPLTPHGAFVYVTTQAIYTGAAVLQTATYGYHSSTPTLLREFRRVRANSGGNWSPWYEIYNSNSLVGPVSQLAGVPTGAVVEQGSNASGQYVRWADGTQICTNDDTAITTPAAAFTGTITKIDGDKLWIGRWF
ncbi:DUF2793 domain-containing protein [Falsiruegeria mediterranea]|uniref:DUF2793 domain-containing protein n=1 Tax=Falsiruegeria mediterranea M17 TaxID=1200281 RepID=A0A2R8CFZ1_9RHOB|nr:DUF2793 domain-containing protein [Falsiruegeria mediterranea]SPJ31349.1 hypothetical protein TRM7615_04892 [Falsiruegeria mediterranea M17]